MGAIKYFGKFVRRHTVGTFPPPRVRLATCPWLVSSSLHSQEYNIHYTECTVMFMYSIVYPSRKFRIPTTVLPIRQGRSTQRFVLKIVIQNILINRHIWEPENPFFLTDFKKFDIVLKN